MTKPKSKLIPTHSTVGTTENQTKDNPLSIQAKAELIAKAKEIEEKDAEIDGLNRKLKEKDGMLPVSGEVLAGSVTERLAQLEAMIRVYTGMQGKSVAIDANDPINPITGKPKCWNTPVTKEDVQDRMVTFSARGTCYVTSSYDLENVRYYAPFKPIVFKFAGSDRRRVGKEEDIINYCVYSTNIKKEIEYLRNHPLFGWQFSENLNDMISADARKLAKMTTMVTRYRGMSMEVLLPMAQRSGLNIAKMGREEMVMELASKAIAQEEKVEREHYERSLQMAAAGIEGHANR